MAGTLRRPCPVCERPITVTKAGVMRQHVDIDAKVYGSGWGKPRCPGSGQRPGKPTTVTVKPTGGVL